MDAPERFDVFIALDGCACSRDSRPNGEYMRYKDHADIVDALRKERDMYQNGFRALLAVCPMAEVNRIYREAGMSSVTFVVDPDDSDDGYRKTPNECFRKDELDQ